ncbi:MAG: assimilatory sulfite reductase (NADPH) flavoprotein subunit [Pseudomonadota bacterium]
MTSQAAGSLALPLDTTQSDRLVAAVDGLTPAQLTWVSGYAAGLAAAGSPGDAALIPAADSSAAAAPQDTLTILYGSQTGHGESVARGLKDAAAAKGFSVKLQSLADYKPSALKRERLVSFVISTHGEGDPPDDAELFHEFLLSAKAPKLDGLRYAVFALGDSSYVNFCQTGREFDGRLKELGAEQLLPIVECDIEFAAEAEAWSGDIVERLPDLMTAASSAPRLRAVETAAQYDRQRPFTATVLTNQKITGGRSGKDVRHIELSLADSGLSYEPGDSLAVLADNPPQLVADLLQHFGFAEDTPVDTDDGQKGLRAALSEEFEITAPSLGFLKAWAARAESEELNRLLGPDRQSELADFFATHQIIDIVRAYPAEVAADEFTGMLRRLAPRAYSIASSHAANPDEVHLTVAVVRYEAFGHSHEGAASTYLADRLGEGDTVQVFVEKNPRFRLPADDNAPVIMIGPGTGVAPFRAFVEERAERGAGGDNWLFFGERSMSEDFLYQLEWQRFLKQGILTRLDVAFSRDQAEKIYVQQRLRERGREVYEWIENGAVLYVCGDSKRMAPDVNAALEDILAEHGGLSAADAAAKLKELRRAGRYQKDVY